MIVAVSLRLLYLLFLQVLRLVLLLGRPSSAKDCGCPKLRAQSVTCPFVHGRWPCMIRWWR